MSGYPLKNPTDASKFRQQYLSSLALQAQNDDINFQANKIYIKTGQTPTQMTDTRTIDEKRADIQRLKLEVRKELSAIADGINTEQILNDITDPVELIFLAQNITEIIRILKPKYKLGILADVFLPFLRTYRAKVERNFGVEDGLQQATGEAILMGVRQIAQLVSPAVLQQLRQEIKDDANSLNRVLYTSLNDKIDDLQKVLPSKEFISAISQIQDAITKATIQELMAQSLEDLPNANDVAKLLSQLKVASSKNDTTRINQIGNVIEGLIALKPQTISQMKYIYRSVQEALPNTRINNPFETQQASASPQTAQQAQQSLALQSPIAPIQSSTIPSPLTRPLNYKQEQDIQKIYEPTDQILAKNLTKEQLFNDYIDPIKKIYVSGITNAMLNIKGGIKSTEQKIKEAVIILNYLIEPLLGFPLTTGAYIITAPASIISPRALLTPQTQKSPVKQGGPAGGAGPLPPSPQLPIAQPPQPPSPALIITKAPKGVKPKKQKGQKIVSVVNISPTNNPPPPPIGGVGIRMKGRGLSRKPSSIIINTEEGIKPQDKYVPLGRYFINKNKLNKNIISIRRESGHSARLPVRLVSDSLSSVVKTIIGGGMPTYDALEKLTDEEKIYLHKLSKESNIIDRLSIPTPNKKELDKNINEFEIMKGEILSGNDNIEYIKKFKLLIIKLINQDILPRNEGKEILIDLASLGY
jgi:hypothetical protein